jgi:hypothetical protein
VLYQFKKNIMAKDINEILDEMDASQALLPGLAPLNSISNVAIFTLFKRLIATVIVSLTKVWDVVRNEISVYASGQIIGTKQWYVTLALQYPTISIQRASCVELGPKVLLKVAKVNSGSTVQLTLSELQGLRAYINSKKIVGSDVDVLSSTADLIDITCSVKYAGTLSVVEQDVKQMIKDYFTTHAFDTPISKTLLIDDILSVAGVLDVSIDALLINEGLGYIPLLGNNAQPSAGYWEVGKNSSSVDLITLNMYL